MEKCIVCECGKILYYQTPAERAPVKCPYCGRDTRHYISMRTDDPRVKKLTGDDVSKDSGTNPDVNINETSDDKLRNNIDDNSTIIEEDNTADMQKSSKTYSLFSEDKAIRIDIPKEGGIIGRTALGGEELAHNGRISREHIKVMPVKRAEGILIEDISANGTMLGTRRLPKNKAVFAVIGSKITMGGEVFEVTRN